MRHFVRAPEPAFLTQMATEWNRQWVDLKMSRPGANFQWYKFENQPVNLLLLPILRQQTQEHCSYCDAFPLGPADNSIDHFRPKSDPRFLHYAYSWDNLYLACADCQRSKGTQFNDLLVAPDKPNYTFYKLFIYNYQTHEIEINPTAPEESQERARATITILNLNDPTLKTSRRHSWERWIMSEMDAMKIDDFPYRFIFD